MAAITPEEVRVLSAAADLDLSMFRPAHLEARVGRALARASAADIGELGWMLDRDESAREEFRRSIAISVTGFFRDADQFDVLEPFLEPLRARMRPRVWSAGCSTGRELWTMAVLLDRLDAAGRTQFLGSDILEENVRKARLGLDGDELGGHTLPPGATLRFEVRDIVRQGAPGTHWDVVLCRNLAIYLEHAARERLHRQLAASLSHGGLLLLGRSERLPDPPALGMEVVGPHLYRKVQAA